MRERLGQASQQREPLLFQEFGFGSGSRTLSLGLLCLNADNRGMGLELMLGQSSIFVAQHLVCVRGKAPGWRAFRTDFEPENP